MLEAASPRSLGDIPASTLVYHGLCAGCNLGLGSPSGFATLRGAFASDYVFALAGRSVLGLRAFTLFALHSVLAVVFACSIARRRLADSTAFRPKSKSPRGEREVNENGLENEKFTFTFEPVEYKPMKGQKRGSLRSNCNSYRDSICRKSSIFFSAWNTTI